MTIPYDETRYLLVQTNTDSGEEQSLHYNEFTMGLTPVANVKQATGFTDYETAEKLAQLQNEIAALMQKPFSYRTIKETITRRNIDVAQ